MRVGSPNLIAISIMVGVVLSLTVPTQPQTSADDFPMPVESGKRNFAVKFKGEVYSWKKISRLLRKHNIPVPPEDILAAVLEQKNSALQSCKDRCFLDERKDNKTCFCDKVCKTLRDCCLDFYSRCNQKDDALPLQDVACGDVNEHPWSGVIMKSSCSSHGYHDCQTVERLNMTLQKELPVFDRTQNVTYRSIGCARCNNEENLSFWGLNISCKHSNWSIATPFNVATVKRFLELQRSKCSWKYAPMQNREQQYRSCVFHDTQCVPNTIHNVSHHLPVMSVVKELCHSYSMVFSVFFDVISHSDRFSNRFFTYRNPHCALCNPEGKSKRNTAHHVFSPPLSILFDVSSNVLPAEEQTTFPPAELISVPDTHNLTHNLTSEMFNCTSNMKNCTVTIGGQICQVSNSSKNLKNQSASRVILMRQRQISIKNDATDLQGNKVFILCPENQAEQGNKGSTFLIYVTFVGTILSIISLCFLLSIYLSFKELRNLPGKCLISVSLALLCYQSIFLGAAKSTEINALCKAVAIFLHFFVLAAFSWMSVMAFDTGNTFTVKVRNTRRQPSDIRKTFIKYCIVGWGLPAVVVALCFVLDFTGTFHFGYGNSTYCWISDKTAIAVGMVTPVSFALIFNAVCLLKNALVIRRLQQGARLAASNRARTSVTLICIKLTTVMGLTWILGLLANWNQTEFLEYPSTVLNSMQGVFIALCFTTTKKVRSLLKERFCNKGNGAAEPQVNVPRDQCQRNTGAETIPGSNKFEMKGLSMEQARQTSS